MNETARNLNEIINIYGFGCEFSKEELVNDFDNIEEVIKSLTENDLIEKNQLSGKYYLSDIFTCNNFLSQYLSEKESEAPSFTTREYDYEIEKEDLIDFSEKLSGFEKSIKKIEVTSSQEKFMIHIKIEIEENMVSKLENRLQS